MIVRVRHFAELELWTYELELAADCRDGELAEAVCVAGCGRLARRLGISPNYLRTWVRGATWLDELRFVALLAELTGDVLP